MHVTVNGHNLYLETTGVGSPAVVLDAGLNATAETWSLVQPKIAAFGREDLLLRVAAQLEATYPGHYRRLTLC